MPDRLIVAYILMAILVMGLLSIVAWHRYHSRDRSYKRDLRRGERIYRAQVAAREAAGDRPLPPHP